MWHREYQDYKTDHPNVKESIEPSRGITGCEMHEVFGWGNSLHHPVKKKHGWLASMITYFFDSHDGDNP